MSDMFKIINDNNNKIINKLPQLPFILKSSIKENKYYLVSSDWNGDYRVTNLNTGDMFSDKTNDLEELLNIFNECRIVNAELHILD